MKTVSLFFCLMVICLYKTLLSEINDFIASALQLAVKVSGIIIFLTNLAISRGREGTSLLT